MGLVYSSLGSKPINIKEMEAAVPWAPPREKTRALSRWAGKARPGAAPDCSPEAVQTRTSGEGPEATLGLAQARGNLSWRWTSSVEHAQIVPSAGGASQECSFLWKQTPASGHRAIYRQSVSTHLITPSWMARGRAAVGVVLQLLSVHGL